MAVIIPKTTPEIVNAFKARNWIVLEELVKQYTEMLLKSSYSLGFRDQQAEDLVQSVWTTFFEAVQKFEGRSQVKTFLFGILINKARELRRETQKFDEHDPIDDVVAERFNEQGGWA